MHLGPAAEAPYRLHGQLAAALDVGRAGRVGGDRGDADEGLEELLEVDPLPVGERQETGAL